MTTATLHALAVYIHASDIETYRSQGWRVSLFGFHHGCNGYALAVLEVEASGDGLSGGGYGMLERPVVEKSEAATLEEAFDGGVLVGVDFLPGLEPGEGRPAHVGLFRERVPAEVQEHPGRPALIRRHHSLHELFCLTKPLQPSSS